MKKSEPQDRAIDAGLRNPRCGAALGAGHISGASCDFPTEHPGPHGVKKQDRAVVAAIWTDGMGTFQARCTQCKWRGGWWRTEATAVKEASAHQQHTMRHNVRPVEGGSK